MAQIPTDELNLAKRVVLWFAEGSGEILVNQLAELSGVDEATLTRWASERGYFFDDGEMLPMEVLPEVWTKFASESRVCLALYTALEELAVTDDRVKTWLKYCDEYLNK